MASATDAVKGFAEQNNKVATPRFQGGVNPYRFYEPLDEYRQSIADEPAIVRLGNYDLTARQYDAFLRYRDLVGITKPVNLVQDRDLTAKYLWFRSEPSETENTGLYKQIVDEELRAHIWYRTSTWAANILLALQILIAASITAIGGSKEARRGTATVVLGAVNTAIAAMLAFLKAKGLPASASHYRDMIKKQKAEIDYMHRAFCIGSANINPASAAAKAHDDFHKAHSDFDTAMSTFQRAATSTHRNLQSAQGTFAKGTATAPTKDGAAVAAPVGDSAEEGGQPSGPEIIAAASETGEGVMKPELQEKEIV